MPTESAALLFGARQRTLGPCCNLWWTLALLLLASPVVLMAQREGGPSGDNPEARGQQPFRPGGQQRPMQMQGGFFRRLRELPPAQQRYIMQNNPQFLRLPPARQELIRERLRQWNAMPPQQKERVREREEILEGLSPEQRREAFTIFPQWRDLTPPRRQAVMVAFRHLRDLPPNERQPFLESQEVREEFSPHERQILEGLNRLLPTTNVKPGEPPDE